MNTTNNNTVATVTAPAPFKFNKPGKLGFAPLSALFISPTNRQCLGINPAHVEGLAISIKKEGWIGTSVLEILPTGEVKSGNHRFLAAQSAGYEGEVPYMVIDPKKASEEDIQIRAYAQNISLGNSPLETSLLVGDLSRKGMKNKAIAARLFASKKGAETIVSQHLSFIRDCPPWLISAIEDGKISYSAAKALLGDKGLEGMRGEIEGRTPENPWVKVKSLSTPTPTTESQQPEVQPEVSEVKDSKESPTPAPTQEAPSVPTALVPTGEVPASVVLVSPSNPALSEVKPDPTLALPTPTIQPDLCRLEADRIISLDSLEKSVGALLALPSGFEKAFDMALKDLGELYGPEKVDAEINRQDPPASDEDIAQAESQPTPTPTGQNNPKDQHTSTISLRSIGKIQSLLKEAMILAPANRAKWLDENCAIREGVVWLKLGSEYCS